VNCQKPFLWLAQKLAGDNALYFVDAPAPNPPEFVLGQAQKVQLERALAAALEQPLPDEDDDDLYDS
jgi:GTP-binding nuclear protein Ran